MSTFSNLRFSALAGASRVVAREEFAVWAQAARTMTAMLLAFAIAFRLDLSSPSSAAVTVAVISLPQSGMVLEKSFYRLLATFCGGLLVLLLIAVFAQLRDLFIVMVALWIGICAAFSAWYRNFQSYGWALAGYTVCLIGFPAYEHADRVFDIVIDRVSIVALGILCGGVINATLFPRSSASSLVQSVRGSFRDFTIFAHAALHGYSSRAELRTTQQQFLLDIVALESARTSSFFEDPESRVRTPRLRRFISQFMVTSTTAHAINRLREDLNARGMCDVLTALQPLHDKFLQALHTQSNTPPAAAAEAVLVVDQLTELLAQWDEYALSARASLRVDAALDQRVELESGLLILREFIEEARDFAETYAELRAPRSALDRLGGEAPVARADRISAIIAGLRAAFALIVVSVFWIASGWPDGFSAALLSAVACTLFVNAPTPARSVWQMVRGFALGFVAAVICFTFVLPALDGLLLMIAGLLPFLMIGTYLMARPQTAGIGSGYCMMFLVSLAITETMQYDIAALLNSGLAQIVGVIVAALAFTVLFPTGSAWHTRRIEKTLWGELKIARNYPLFDVRHRFESGVRDLTLQYMNLATNAAIRQQRVIASMTLLEAGRATIALRNIAGHTELKLFAAEITTLLDTAVNTFTGAPTTRVAGRFTAIAQRIQTLQTEVETALAQSMQPPLITLRTALQLLQLALIERRTQLQNSAESILAEDMQHAARA